LTQRIPYPPIKGEKIRPLQILHHLRRSFDIHLGTMIDEPGDWAYADTIRGFCRDTYFAALNRKWAKVSCLRGLTSGDPLSVTFFRDRGLQSWVDNTLEHVRPDVVFVCSGNMAPYVLAHRYRGKVRIVDLADVDSEKWRAYSMKAKGPMKWVYGREAQLTLKLEQRILRESDAVTFVTEPEAALFRQLAPEFPGRIHGISSGVDFAYFNATATYAAPYNSRLPTFVFTGTMDYPPNIDAVCWFAGEILPLIRQELPEAQFYIVGSSPSAAVIKLTETEGIHVTGRVPDVRPYLAEASACVVPLRLARGIQNKVLEAMAMGRATIVSPEALEGIDATPGQELVCAQGAAAFAAAAVALARHPHEAARIGGAARRKIEDKYSWSARLSAFDSLITDALPNHSDRNPGMENPVSLVTGGS
jgi:sugar transferase (PEP-CTERM/EpsH1 system associated)